MSIDVNGVFEEGILYNFPSLVTYETYLWRVNVLMKKGLPEQSAIMRATAEVIECFLDEERIASEKLPSFTSQSRSKLQPFFSQSFK